MTSNGTTPQSSPWPASHLGFCWTTYFTDCCFPTFSEKRSKDCMSRAATSHLPSFCYARFALPPTSYTLHYLETIRCTILERTLKEYSCEWCIQIILVYSSCQIISNAFLVNAQEWNKTTLGVDMAAFGMEVLPKQNQNKQQYRAFSTDYEWRNRRQLFSRLHSPTIHGIQKVWKLHKSQRYYSKLLNEVQ